MWKERCPSLLVETECPYGFGIIHSMVMSWKTAGIVLDGPAEKLKNNEDVKEFLSGL